ncbi:hypothetical protein PI125_g13021 [Phytophthora idaei]|nr:hypothetical protein PI125_g13021 [Phytophthora idaei]
MLLTAVGWPPRIFISSYIIKQNKGGLSTLSDHL